jgi:hypothetical protein
MKNMLDLTRKTEMDSLKQISAKCSEKDREYQQLSLVEHLKSYEINDMN